MFKILADEYVNIFTVLNLFSYITIRTGAAILTSLFFSLIFGELIIKSLSNIQPSGQPIRNDGPETHILNKVGSPTMGGVLIIMSILVSLILWADLKNNFIWISILSCLSFGFIGFYDDYLKVKSNSSNGLKVRTRIIVQLLMSFLVVYVFSRTHVL